MGTASVGLALLASLIPCAASAATPDRTLGLGLGSSALVGGTSDSASGGGAGLSLVDLELEMGLGPHRTLQLSLPIGNMMLAALEGRSAVMRANVFLKWSPAGGAGVYASPGLGIVYGTRPSESAAGPELAVRLGYELSTTDRRLAFTVGFRPWLDLLARSDGGGAVAYGVAFELGVHVYGT